MISVLLPTIRPHLIRRAYDSIAPAAEGVAHEILVVADFGLIDVFNRDFPASLNMPMRWIVSERKGVADAMKLATDAARGEYLFAFNDESVLEPGALRTLYQEAERHPGEVLTPRHLPPFDFRYYGLPFAPFPFVHRDIVKRLGGLFDPAYKCFYADPDFSMRAHAAGVPIRVVDAVLVHHNNHDDAHQMNMSAHLEADRALFRSRWDYLGPFHDP